MNDSEIAFVSTGNIPMTLRRAPQGLTLVGYIGRAHLMKRLQKAIATHPRRGCKGIPKMLNIIQVVYHNGMAIAIVKGRGGERRPHITFREVQPKDDAFLRSLIGAKHL